MNIIVTIMIIVILNIQALRKKLIEILIFILISFLNNLLFLIILKFLKINTIIHKRIIIEDFLCMKNKKKNFILLVKITYYFITFKITKNFHNEYIIFFSKTNCLYFILNFLPVTPMFLGEVLCILVSKFKGDINALKLMNGVSNVVSGFIIFGGFIFTIFYPYNIYIMLLGVYLKTINSDKRYLSTSIGNLFKNKSNIKINVIYVDSNLSIKEIVERMNFNKYNIICFEKEKEYIVITEEKIKSKILCNDLHLEIKNIELY